MPPRVTELKLHQKSRYLEVAFDDGSRHNLSCEYLRVFSPSAEVRGHGPGQEVLQIGKEGVNISAIEPVGQYGVKLVFDDGHHTGIYSWTVLYELARDYEHNWPTYLARLEKAGYQRKQPSRE
jgi:DUF971 family protein